MRVCIDRSKKAPRAAFNPLIDVATWIGIFIKRVSSSSSITPQTRASMYVRQPPPTLAIRV